MGGSLLRSMRHNDNSTGLTIIDHPVPTLTIAGTKDGLYRISRNAESYYHHVQNNKNPGNHPVIVLPGLNHASFMDKKYSTSIVKDNDLFNDVDEQTGFK